MVNKFETDREEIEEVEYDETSDAYPAEDKLFNMIASQMSEQPCKPDRRRL